MDTTRTKLGAQEKLRIAKQTYDAYNRRDFAAASDSYTDDVVWHFAGGPVRGKDAVAAYGKDQATRFDAKLDTHDILASDDHVVALLRYTVSGKPYRLIHVAHTNDEGKITEGWSFGEPELVDAIRKS